MFKNEVLIELEEKKRLIALLSEAKTILDKYPYSNDHSLHVITAMSRAKASVNDSLNTIKCLYVTGGTQRNE